MRKLVAGLFLTTFVLGACVCGDAPACSKVRPDAVIFVGVSLTDAGFGGSARFTIERSFAGIEPGTSSINVDPASRTSCSVEFKMGQRYLVYAYRLKNGAVFTTQCAGSKLIAQADDDLRFLEAWARGLSITTIQGNVRPAFGYESNELYGRQLARLAGSTVRAIGAGGLNYTGRVGGSGSYNIVGVRPGAYTMSLSQADFRPTECDYQVEVPLGGCGVASAFMNPDGRVLGRLQSSDGETPPPVVIQLISYAMGKCRLTMRWRQPARHTFVWSDGRPAPFIHIWCSARGYLPIVHEITDKSGRIDFDVLDGLTYEVGGAASSDYEPVERRRYSPSRSA